MIRKSFAVCLLLPALTVCLGAAGAQEPAKPVSAAERAPSVIPVPRAEPVVPASPAKSIATQLNDAFVSVFEHVAPSVVVIDVVKRPSPDGDGADDVPDFLRSPGSGSGGAGDGTEDFHSQPARRAAPSEGSGFIIMAGGFILTNYHVVNNAEKITVTLKDGRKFPGKIVGTDEKTDIAVVRIEATDLPVAELADSDAVRVGEIVFAIGVPFKLDYSFTQGVVSAKGRNQRELDIPMQQDNYEDFIQTDASINPGNSGGPLVDLDGKVIGMNTLINGLSRGLAFAIPSTMLREVGDQLIHAGRVVRPYIGVRIVSVGEDTADRFASVFNGIKRGVIVQTMMFDTPAFHSELRPADVITEVDGVPVNSDRELQKQVLSKKVGAVVQLSVYRRGKLIKVPVTTGELPAAVAEAGPVDGDSAPHETPEATRQDAASLYGMQLKESGSGVMISALAEESPAAKAGMQVSDVITSVDDKPVKDVAAFKEAVKAADPKRGILCNIERITGKTFAVIKSE